MNVEQMICDLAGELCIDLVGFADASCLPTQVTEGLPRAISLAVALDPVAIREIECGPTPRYFDEYSRANAMLNRVSEQVADGIRNAGWKARAFRATTEEFDKATLSAKLQHKTIATRAGLGWIGKSGLHEKGQGVDGTHRHPGDDLRRVRQHLSLDSTVPRPQIGTGGPARLRFRRLLSQASGSGISIRLDTKTKDARYTKWKLS